MTGMWQRGAQRQPLAAMRAAACPLNGQRKADFWQKNGLLGYAGSPP